MTAPDAAAAFEAFREAVWDDFHLLRRLRPPLEREVYVAQILAIAAARGFAFDAEAVREALGRGESTWLMQAGNAP